MRIYIDCEFNGYAGELISMALVKEDGEEWYRILHEPRVWNEWVHENVLPVLGGEAIGWDNFTAELKSFLDACDGCEFIADHPADLKHLSEQMDIISSGNDFRILIECTMTLLRGSPDIKSEIPHNALSDARALRDWHQSTLKPEPETPAAERLRASA